MRAYGREERHRHVALVAAAPARITAAVLQQPIGLSGDNHGAFHKMFDAWAEELVQTQSGGANWLSWIRN